MKKILFAFLLLSISAFSQPCPDSPISDFKYFIQNVLDKLEDQKFKSVAFVMRDSKDTISEILIYKMQDVNTVELSLVNVESPSGNFFIDSYIYKKYFDQYFLVSKDSVKNNAVFSENYVDGKLELTVNGLDIFNCRTNSDSTEKRIVNFDQNGRLLNISNGKKSIEIITYGATKNNFTDVEMKKRCASCGYGNEPPVLTLDTVSTINTMFRKAINDTEYSLMFERNSTAVYMNCEWHTEQLSSKKIEFVVNENSKHEIINVSISSIEIHNNEYNVFKTESNKLAVLYFDDIIADISVFIKGQISRK